MGTVESFSIVPAAKIDRTPVRAANTCSLDTEHFTKRWAAHARVEWPDSTDAYWAAAAGVNVRLAQYWLAEEPMRRVSAAGVSAVIARMCRRDSR